MTLDDVRRWDPSALSAVSRATRSRAEDTVSTSSALRTELSAVPWDGAAADAARRRMSRLCAELDAHAAECHRVSGVAAQSATLLTQVRSNLAEIAAFAAANELNVEYRTGAVFFDASPAMTPTELNRKRALAERVSAQLHDVLTDARALDSYLAEGLSNPDTPLSFGPGDGPQQSSPDYEKVYGHPPVTDADREKASWLDPDNADPALQGVDSSVVVARIKPVPGQGVVRGSLFIAEEKVLDPFSPDGWDPGSYTSGFDYGNNRGFDEHFDPRNAKGAFLIDYEEGVVIFRQNPTHDTSGQVAIGTPEVAVTQAGDGTVRLDYHLPNPAAMLGPVNMAEAGGMPVAGTILVSPGGDGPTSSGLIGDYPSAEIYADSPAGGTRVLLRDDQDNHTVFGPILELGSYHVVGELPGAAIQRELNFSSTTPVIAGRTGITQDILVNPTLNPRGTRLTAP